MVDIPTAMDRMERQNLTDKLITVARTVIDERLSVMEQQQDKLTRLTTKLFDTLDVADRAAAIITAKMQKQMQEQGRWVCVEETMPQPDQWYVGLTATSEKDIRTGKMSTVYRMIRGYPSKYAPLNPDMRFWFLLPNPVGLVPTVINDTEVAKTEKRI